MSTRGLVLAGVAGVVAWAVLALVNKKDKDSQKNKADNANPRRVFKLATKAEVASFQKQGLVRSSLDRTDSFVHLSDSTSVRLVASLFFKECPDLVLLEIDAWKLPPSVKWIRDAQPPENAKPLQPSQCTSATTIHYLYNNGCIHVYSAGAAEADAVPCTAIVREADVPLGSDGKHAFPDWLP